VHIIILSHVRTHCLILLYVPPCPLVSYCRLDIATLIEIGYCQIHIIKKVFFYFFLKEQILQKKRKRDTDISRDGYAKQQDMVDKSFSVVVCLFPYESLIINLLPQFLCPYNNVSCHGR